MTMVRDCGSESISTNDVGDGRKRGQVRIAKWPEGCFALLVPDPFSSRAKQYAISKNALADDVGFVTLVDRVGSGEKEELRCSDDGLSRHAANDRNVKIENHRLLAIDMGAHRRTLIVDQISKLQLLPAIDVAFDADIGDQQDAFAVLGWNGVARHAAGDDEIAIGVDAGLQTRTIVQCL
jgi:hypothetical protein